MPRIIISPLTAEQTLFHTDLTIQISDINYGNHLSNDAVLRLCHEARLRWLKQKDWSEINAGGAGLIMADAAIQFTAQGHYADPIRISIGAPEIGRSGFMLQYDITNTSNNHPIARVQTGMVCFDYQTQKPMPIPAPLHDYLTSA